VTTYAGVPEIAPEWVASHRDTVQLLDVRNPAEWTGELCSLQGAQAIPLDELRARANEVAKGKPVIVICQTGRRAALGAGILAKAGFKDVANLSGGLVRWRELGLPS
jgi:sulfur dioxygenase